MARNKETFTYEIKAEANTTQAENKINSLVDKINSSTSKSTIDTKGIDDAIRKLNSLKKKQQELIDQNDKITTELSSATFSAKLEDKANKTIENNIKQLGELKREITNLRNEYKKLGVDLDNAKLSTNTTKASANIAKEVDNVKALQAEQLKLIKISNDLKHQLASDSGNKSLINKLNDAKARVQAATDALEAAKRANKSTDSAVKSKPIETVVQPKVTKPIEAEVNPVVPKKIGEVPEAEILRRVCPLRVH